MNKIKRFFSGLFKNVWFGIKTCFLASKFYFSMKLIILMFTTLIPLVNLWLWKEVLNGIGDFGNIGQVLAAAKTAAADDGNFVGFHSRSSKL